MFEGFLKIGKKYCTNMLHGDICYKYIYMHQLSGWVRMLPVNGTLRYDQTTQKDFVCGSGGWCWSG